MENEPKVFENEEFGKVRMLEINGEPWLVGKDVAIALGYNNPQKAIRDHVDGEDMRVKESYTIGGSEVNDSFTPDPLGALLINESGLYSLILGSKLP